eukprot:g2571.t1
MSFIVDRSSPRLFESFAIRLSTSCASRAPLRIRRSEFVQLSVRKFPTGQALRIRSGPDYSPSASDDELFRRPSKTKLVAEEVRSVFGYPRDVSEKYAFGEVIGTGSYGVVRKCIEMDTGAVFAVKTIPKQPKRGNPCTPRYLLKLRNEIEVMRQLGASLNAVYLKAAFEDDASVHLIMELCEGGSLLSRVVRGQETEKSIANIVRSILQFIAQCHSKGIVYRDVKTENFLFQDESPESPLKATDFGLSIRHAPYEAPLTSRTGTPVYMAPEVILQSYTTQCDLWSVGMMTCQLLTGRFPHWKEVSKVGLKDLWKSILTVKVDLSTAYWRSKLSRDARDFLSKLLTRDPRKRITAAEALRHPWVMEGGTAEDMFLEGSVMQRLQRFATYGDLKQLILMKISQEILEPSDMDKKFMMNFGNELRQLFDELDTDGSGSISTEELADGLRSQGYFLSNDEAQQLLTKIDVDNSGLIDFDEFMATLTDWSEIENNQSEWVVYLDRVFSKIDKDGNGFISLDELIDYIPPEGENSVDEIETQARRMLREADTNQDGQISKQEFYDLMMSTVVPDALEQYDARLHTKSNVSRST